MIVSCCTCFWITNLGFLTAKNKGYSYQAITI